MGREVVTGYCWPQSAGPGEQVGLHMSSSGARPVRVEVARVGTRREVVFSSDAVAADEHASGPTQLALILKTFSCWAKSCESDATWVGAKTPPVASYPFAR